MQLESRESLVVEQAKPNRLQRPERDPQSSLDTLLGSGVPALVGGFAAAAAGGLAVGPAIGVAAMAGLGYSLLRLRNQQD